MIKWHAEQRNIYELKNWDKNPRILTEVSFNKLKDRIAKRGMHDILKIDLHNTVLSGNQRLRALKELKYTEVDVMLPDRELTTQEMDAIALESNTNDGVWDVDMLANDFEDLVLEDVGLKMPEDLIPKDDIEREDINPKQNKATVVECVCPECNFEFTKEI